MDIVRGVFGSVSCWFGNGKTTASLKLAEWRERLLRSRRSASRVK